jgi:hypothetical protein
MWSLAPRQGYSRPFWTGNEPPHVTFRQAKRTRIEGANVERLRVADASIVGQDFSFEATLENWAEGMDYCAIPVPAKITRALGTHAAVAVTARLNESAPFPVSLFPVGGGRHYIRIRAKIRKETGTKVGDVVLMRITVVDRAAVANPADLRSALQAAGVEKDFNALTPGRRSFIIRRIEEAAKPETRRKRIQEAVSTAQKARARPGR